MSGPSHELTIAINIDRIKTYPLVCFQNIVYAKAETAIANPLDSAEQLSVAGSLDSVSMQKIVELANVTKAPPYHQCDGKEGLYVALTGSNAWRPSDCICWNNTGNSQLALEKEVIYRDE